ncbi:MAG: homocysteine S-methyltransferase family protein [Sedimentisphaerales bacterium]|nr:homocysteine S-methyltransferase family protein [Sedimentisphaerales bacterium]
MARPGLKDKIDSSILLLDGAMGTQLIAAGAEVAYNDRLNIESPDIVKNVHKAYIEAGSDIIITNTFGANGIALGRHNLSERVSQINTAGAQIARQVAGDDKYVLGNIGPCGDFLQPVGTLTPQQLQKSFTEQTVALVQGGIDGLIIETMTALEELEIAVKAAQSAAGDLPVFASMAFDCAGDNFKTMMGVSVELMVKKLLELEVDGLGFNCGRMTLDDYVRLAEKIVSLVDSNNVILFAEPNAGLPEIVGAETVYKVEPDEFASALLKIRDVGFRVLGGCCGTTPAHIKAAAKLLKSV